MRDLWLHLYCCALTWTDPDADILDMIVARASAVAPGLKPRDVARMMGPTVRRGLAEVRARAKGRDPRYDYSGARLCELLAVDRDLAVRLELRQVIPNDLRADRNRQRRTSRRRAEGALPRAPWLAANSLSEHKPWEAQGISRATFYRRRGAARLHGVRACPGALGAELAEASGPRETGADLLYKGEALPSRSESWRRDRKPAQICTGVDSFPTPEKKTRRRGDERRVADGAVGVSSSMEPDPPSFTTHRRPTVQQRQLDLSVLREAARRLSHAELGALTRIAIELERGSFGRVDLGRRANVAPDMLDRIDCWLHLSPQSGLVSGLEVPGLEPRQARGPRQGLLFDGEATAPAPDPSNKPMSLRALTIAAGVRVLGKAGFSERTARPFLGKILKETSFGVLAEARCAGIETSGDG